MSPSWMRATISNSRRFDRARSRIQILDDTGGLLTVRSYGIERVTTAPGAEIELSPMVTPGR